MQRQITQFDTERTAATVATPTCSSSCCCCCCLTTTLASSTILARRINKEAKQKKIKDPVGLTIFAALFLPVIAVLTYLVIFAINKGLGHCTVQTYSYGYGISTTQFCSNPASSIYVLYPLGFIVSIFVLETIIINAAFGVEILGVILLLQIGVGWIAYPILIPVLYGAVQRFYSRKILHNTMLGKNIRNA